MGGFNRKLLALLLALSMVMTATTGVYAADAQFETTSETISEESSTEALTEAAEEAPESPYLSETEEEILTSEDATLDETEALSDGQDEVYEIPYNSFVYVNPLYADVITEEAISNQVENREEASPSKAKARARAAYATSDAEVAVELRDNMEARATSFSVPYQTSQAFNFTQEWLEGILDIAFEETESATQGDYLKWHYGSINLSVKGYIQDGTYYYTIYFTVSYYTSAEQEDAVTEQVNEIISSFGFDESTSEYEKIKTIYDWMCGHIAYDYTNLNDNDYTLKYSAYAALINRTSVCQGYASLFYRFCREVGLSVRMIPGTSQNQNHAWNIVRIGDSWYNVDATWDAGLTKYNFFLKNEAEFTYHTRDAAYATTDFYQTYPMAENSYTGATWQISYDANGGEGAPSAQTKTEGIALTLSDTKPTKSYTITYDANGGSVSTTTKNVAATFNGWNTLQDGKGTAYSAGGSYTANSAATLYAQWSNPSAGTLATPTKTGSGFDGWYTAKSGGTKVTETTVLSGDMTVYAHWTENGYTISYDANGGTGAPSSQTKTFGAALTLSSTKPTKSYTITYNANGGSVSSTTKSVTATFNGWNTAQDGKGTAYSAGGSYTANSAATLYAQWSNPSAGTLATPTRTGYTFAGWYTAKSGGTKVTETTVISSNTTIYAHWTANTYTISYDANGGTGAPSSQTKTYGAALTLSSTKPTKSYTITYNANGGSVSSTTKSVAATFNGWNTAQDGKGTAYSAGGSYTANSAATLYAQWSNPSAGTLATPTKTGYGFDGWYTAKSGGTKVTETTVISSNITVYAHWTANGYTISYDANGGTGAPSSQTKTFGAALTLSSTKPTKSYTITYNANGGSVSPTTKSVSATFSGWNTAQDGKGTAYSAGGSYTANSAATLYAQWSNPSAGALASPTRTDYTFDGWYTAKTGGTKVTAATVVSSNITVYAHWTAVVVNVDPSKTSIRADVNTEGTVMTIVLSGLNEQAVSKELQFAVWSAENGQDDLKWYTAKQSGSDWSYSVDLKNHKSVGLYYVDAYIVNQSGKKQFVKSTTCTIAKVEKGTMTMVADGTGYMNIAIEGLEHTEAIDNIRVAVWTTKSHDDLQWYAAQLSDNGAYTVDANVKNHKYNLGLYYADAYVTMKNGARYYLQGVTCKVNLSADKLTLTPNSEGTTLDVVLSGLVEHSVSKEVRFAVWSAENGQDDLKWYTAKQSGSDLTYSVDLKNHKSAGLYYVDAYVVDKNGNKKFVKSSTCTVAKVEKGTMTMVADGTGYMNIAIEGLEHTEAIDYIRVAVWTTKNHSDLKWYMAQSSDTGAYTVAANVKNHKYNLGLYYADAYVTMKNGASYYLQGVTLKLAASANQLTSTALTNKTYLKLTGLVTHGAGTKVKVAVWSAKNGQDDLYWYDMSLNSGSYVAWVLHSKHKDTGLYYADVYLEGTNGQKYFVKGITFNVN